MVNVRSTGRDRLSSTENQLSELQIVLQYDNISADGRGTGGTRCSFPLFV